MFYSQCLLSSKGPLGAIWVAAYFFKKLKKTQIAETNISSSVDKILQDELDVVTYRVLAYLLLGVVRIFSKKVEYLFDDCHKVLIKINDFVVSTKANEHVENFCAPYFSITLPERFELDAFDLEIIEDVSGGNVVPYEQITLKDGSRKNEKMGQYSLDKYHYEDFSLFQTTCSTDYTLADNVLSSVPMDIDMEVSTSCGLANLKVNTEKLQDERFSPAECVDLETFLETEVPEKAPLEDEITGEACTEKIQDCTFSHEGCVNLEMFCTTDEEPAVHINLSAEDHQIDGEQIKVTELAQSENKTHPVIRETHDLSNLETSMEKLRVEKFAHEECMDLDMFGGAKEEPPELVRKFNEEHHNDAEPKELPSLTSFENKKCQVNTEEHPLSVTVDRTPKSKFPDASGATTPEFMFIPTPTTRERARPSRKRKCLIDEFIVLPNEVLRQSIHDASDLVSKRGASRRNALAVWKTSRISSLHQGFLEPLMPCISSELRSLFYTKKLKILQSSELPVGISEHMPESPTVGRSEHKPESPNIGTSEHKPESPNVGTSENRPESPNVDRSEYKPESTTVGRSEHKPESLTVARSEEIVIAPETPVKCSTSIRSFESPKNTENPDFEGVRPASSFGDVEKEASMRKDWDLDFNLMNEEIDLCGADNEEHYGWSGRTRMAARYLHKTFVNREKGGEEEVVSLSRLLEGRTKKESARLFYEILVLGTTGYVDVEQNNAYGDIQVCKLSKWDQIYGADGI
ncbi:LOW QUALITY PROTEIN: sister chromatid cohesion 1 protein 2 [Quercus suber]|uniref:LOW QUALITY PROTEIN: sister chromatid cohesion 1 protein 2 n=1 Tax=Quercus suber TaxID=58331 RepID=UPI0032DE4CFC